MFLDNHTKVNFGGEGLIEKIVKNLSLKIYKKPGYVEVRLQN
jgi:hypothetical protein